MSEIPLGAHITESGNRCTIGLRVQKPAKVTVDFTWDRVPTADDREEWSLAILGKGLEGALEHAFRERAVVEMLRKFVAEGTIERVGTRAGDWVFRGAKDAAAPLPAGVVSLATKRLERNPHCR